MFERLGISTVGQVRRMAVTTLVHYFGKHGQHLWELANGIDPRVVVSDRDAKSISHETTFERDLRDNSVLRAILLDLTEQVAWRLRRHGLKGRTVHLKARSNDFRTVTRARTLSEPTDTTQVLWRAVAELFDSRLPQDHLPLRLIGMGVSGFDAPPSAQQGDLFAVQEYHDGRRQRDIDNLADRINARFGRTALKRGTVFKKPS